MEPIEIAQLVKVVHDKDFMEALEAYINYRIELRRDALMTPGNEDRHRGAIDELMKLKNIKASVLDKRVANG